ncbi:hypothetical protein BGZ94_008672 [Podila epigama]|nr:hypothetical protein BGZ94_008672 [Podila epigama]
MTRIIGAILLHRKLRSALHETYGAFYQLMSKTQFMSFALIAIGFCSRLSLISKAWINEMAETYSLLDTWKASFPKEEIPRGEIDYEQQLPSSIDALFEEQIPDLPTRVPTDELPSTPSEDTGFSRGGVDIGEVISRPSQPATPQSVASQPATPKSTQLSSAASKNDDTRSQGSLKDDDEEPNDKDTHNSLLGELDTIFGKSLLSAQEKIQHDVPAKRKQKDDFDLDSLFDGSKKKTRKVKGIKPAETTPETTTMAKAMATTVQTKVSSTSREHSTTTVTTTTTQSKKKQSASLPALSNVGALSNFDAIFNDNAPVASQGSKKTITKKQDGSGKDKKKEIDDIFGTLTNKKKKKKSASSEIDSIFGSSKKKK